MSFAMGWRAKVRMYQELFDLEGEVQTTVKGFPGKVTAQAILGPGHVVEGIAEEPVEAVERMNQNLADRISQAVRDRVVPTKWVADHFEREAEGLGQWVVSDDDEWFESNDRYDSKEDAIAAARAEYAPLEDVWIGRIAPLHVTQFIDADDIENAIIEGVADATLAYAHLSPDAVFEEFSDATRASINVLLDTLGSHIKVHNIEASEKLKPWVPTPDEFDELHPEDSPGGNPVWWAIGDEYRATIGPFDKGAYLSHRTREEAIEAAIARHREVIDALDD